MTCGHKKQIIRGNQLECDNCGAALDCCPDCWRGNHDKCIKADGGSLTRLASMLCECNHTKDVRTA